jgi:hypothetical protein
VVRQQWLQPLGGISCQFLVEIGLPNIAENIPTTYFNYLDARDSRQRGRFVTKQKQQIWESRDTTCPQNGRLVAATEAPQRKQNPPPHST